MLCDRSFRNTSEPQEHVVELRTEVPIPFTLGGRRGNIVTHSACNRIQKGWRLVAVNDHRLHSLENHAASDPRSGHSMGSDELKTLMVRAREGSDGRAKYTISFVDPLAPPRRSAPRQNQCSAAANEVETAEVNSERKLPDEVIFAEEAVHEGIQEEVGLALSESSEPELLEPVAPPPPAGSPPQEKLQTVGALDALPPKGELEDPQQALMEALTRPPPIKKVGPCDKCDGPHHADDCPHFKKARDDHADAWQSYGKKGESTLDTTPEILRDARVVAQPGDGSCLFHSLAFGLGAARGALDDGASALRREIAEFVRRNPAVTIQGTPVKDWVLWDSGLGVDDYAARMATGHHWGGAIEMAICSLLRNVRIQVFERQNSREFKLISSFGSQMATDLVVKVVYGGRVHYDALEVQMEG